MIRFGNAYQLWVNPFRGNGVMEGFYESAEQAQAAIPPDAKEWRIVMVRANV
jgi:hypothetical protein